MQISTIKQNLVFGHTSQAIAASHPGEFTRAGYNAKTILPFDPSENAVKIETEKNGNRTYFYADTSGKIERSTTYHNSKVIKREKYDAITENKIQEKRYFKDGGMSVSTFDAENGGIVHKAEYDRTGLLFEEDTFASKTKTRLTNLRYDRIDPNCYTFRKFDQETGELIYVETCVKDGKHSYKTEKKEIKPRKK
jgi:hypothetical protein